MGLVTEALTAQESVLILEEEFRPKSYISYGQILLFAKAYDVAEKYLLLALENTKDRWEKSFALGILSQVYLHAENFDKAKETIELKAEKKL